MALITAYVACGQLEKAKQVWAQAVLLFGSKPNRKIDVLCMIQIAS